MPPTPLEISMSKPLPRGFFPLEEICCNCHYWTWKYRPVEEGRGWCFCKWYGKWFQYQFESTHTPAGSRTCEHWTQKGTVNADRRRDHEKA
jgi:hypothetical protein